MISKDEWEMIDRINRAHKYNRQHFQELTKEEQEEFLEEEARRAEQARPMKIVLACTGIVLALALVFAIIVQDDDGYMSTPASSIRSNDDPEVLTDWEYENVPGNELSDMERKQAAERIAKELEEAGVLEEMGIEAEGSKRDR